MASVKMRDVTSSHAEVSMSAYDLFPSGHRRSIDSESEPLFAHPHIFARYRKQVQTRKNVQITPQHIPISASISLLSFDDRINALLATHLIL